MSAGPKDRIFAEPAKRASDFVFDGRTAAVFDDMLVRSVPFYTELQRMSGELAADFAVPGSNLYDLGCSTGPPSSSSDPSWIHRFASSGWTTPEMLEKARQS
jgi:tRNA (cmo5U34)-methyltransferase